MNLPSLLVRVFGLSLCLGFLPANPSPAQDSPSANATPDAEREKAVAEFHRIRRDTIREIDGGFFKQSHFTPEQEELFIKVRLAAEDRFRTRLEQTKGASLHVEKMWEDMYGGLSKAFGSKLGDQYREYHETQQGREVILLNPDLKAKEWLTDDEIEQLARAWGPTCSQMLSFAMSPEYKVTTPAQKLAAWDNYVAEYLRTAKPILPASKFLKLHEYYTTARPKALAYFETGIE